MPWNLENAPGPVVTPVDPYLQWALDPNAGKIDYLPLDEGFRIPLLFRLAKGTKLDLMYVLDQLPGGEKERWVSFREQLEKAPATPNDRFVSVLVPPEDAVKLLSAASPRQFILEDQFSIYTLGPPLPSDLVAPGDALSAKASAPSSQSGGGSAQARPVVVGIIDDGLAFAHERFRSAAAASRFEALWLQDGKPATGGDLKFGREILKADIDGWLLRHADDEERLYAQSPSGDLEDSSGALDFGEPGHKSLAQRLAHGTHVLDLAFGFDPSKAPDWPIIGVQLPYRVVADSSGSHLTPYVLEAVAYIERRAIELCPGTPIVIAMSYGLTAGPHDGMHPIERGIHDIISAHNNDYPDAKMRIVIPSGNSHLDRLHARIVFPAPTEADPLPLQSEELFWRVQPDDTTPSFIEVWLPGAYDPNGRLGLVLTTPNGERSPELVEGQAKLLTLSDGEAVICRAYFRVDPKSSRAMFLIALQPTVRAEPEPRTAASGLWSIEFIDHGLAGGLPVEVWIQRDEAPFGYPPRGRQSYFDDPRYVRFDQSGRKEQDDIPSCPVQRAGSMNALATGTTPIVVGGLDAKQLTPAYYSAGGSEGSTPGPAALVTSDDLAVHGGLIAAGTRSNSWVAMNGTSVAGPLTARWAAGQLASDDSCNKPALEERARKEEHNFPPGTPCRPKPERGGAGRLPFPGPVTNRLEPDDA